MSFECTHEQPILIINTGTLTERANKFHAFKTVLRTRTVGMSIAINI